MQKTTVLSKSQMVMTSEASEPGFLVEIVEHGDHGSVDVSVHVQVRWAAKLNGGRTAAEVLAEALAAAHRAAEDVLPRGSVP